MTSVDAEVTNFYGGENGKTVNWHKYANMSYTKGRRNLKFLIYPLTAFFGV